MANDRLGVRWGLAGGTTLATVEEVRAAARFADASGFDSLWVSHAMAVHPIVALACVGTDVPHLTELGTSVVPLYGRHPIDVAQQAMTAQTALGGRFTLGIGAASNRWLAGKLSMWTQPRSRPRIVCEERRRGPNSCLRPNSSWVLSRRMNPRTTVSAPNAPSGVC